MIAFSQSSANKAVPNEVFIIYDSCLLKVLKTNFNTSEDIPLIPKDL